MRHFYILSRWAWKVIIQSFSLYSLSDVSMKLPFKMAGTMIRSQLVETGLFSIFHHFPNPIIAINPLLI